MPDLKHITDQADDVVPGTAPDSGTGESRAGRTAERDRAFRTARESREAGCDPYNSVGSGVFRVG